MTIGEFLTQYAGAFFGFLGAALPPAWPVWLRQGQRHRR